MVCLVVHSLFPHLLSSHSLVLADAAFFLAILLYSLVRPIHLAAWWYPILFYIQVKMHVYVHRSNYLVIELLYMKMYCLQTEL